MSYHDEDFDPREYADCEPRHTYKYHCGDRTCGASDCGDCRNGPAPWEEAGDEEQESRYLIKTVKARKARNVGMSTEIRPGDTVRVTSFFTYRENGPRTGYFHSYYRVAKGPAWNVQAAA